MNARSAATPPNKTDFLAIVEIQAVRSQQMPQAIILLSSLKHNPIGQKKLLLQAVLQLHPINFEPKKLHLRQIHQKLLLENA